MKTFDLIASYDALVDRALEIVKTYGTGFHAFVAEPHFARLRVDDNDMAVLRYPELESGYYDSGDTIEEREARFPAALLLMSDYEMESWKKEQEENYRRQCNAQSAGERRKRELQERELLAALKAKYER